MGILNWLNRSPLVIRYNNGSWEYNKNSTRYRSDEYMQLYLTVYAVNACINIRANYLSKFKWGVQESEGINYDDPLLDIIKKPNIYQKSTVDFLKQYEILRCVNGWVYQKTFGAKGFYPDALYNLNPSNIDFKENKNPFLIWRKKDINDSKDKMFTYDDNGTKKTFKFSEIMPFFDTTNGISCNQDSMYTSPSKIQAILKNISNLDLSLDAENVVIQTAGREALYSEGDSDNKAKTMVMGSKPLKDKEVKDIRNRINNKSMLKSQQIRTFNPDVKIGYQNMGLKPKDYDYEPSMTKQESVVARAFGVPNEIYRVYKQGDTFNNQSIAEVKMLDNMKEEVVSDLELTWTDGFGDKNKPFVGTIDHLRSLQEEESKKADKAFKITQSLVNLQKVGMNESDAIQFLEGLGVNLNS